MATYRLRSHPEFSLDTKYGVDHTPKTRLQQVSKESFVRSNIRAATTDDVGTAYNIGTGESTTIRELAEQIRDITGTQSEIVHTESRSGDIEHSTADISRARSQLSYEPTVSLRAGLKQTVDWYRSQ